MELHEDIALIDNLLREATHQRELLENTMNAQQKAGTVGSSTAPGRSYHPQPYTLHKERELWEKVHHGLTVVRSALGQIEQSKRQRAQNRQ
jgi:hypothetical protein